MIQNFCILNYGLLIKILIEIKDKINIALVINLSITYKNDMLFTSAKRSNIVKGYGFLSSAKNMGRNIGKNISKNVSSKHSQKLLDHATDALKTASKRAIQESSRSNC